MHVIMHNLILGLQDNSFSSELWGNIINLTMQLLFLILFL